MAHKPLTDEQLRVLLTVPYDDMPRVFKGYTEKFLRAERRRAKAQFPPETLIDLREAERLRTSEIHQLERQVSSLAEERRQLTREMAALRAVLGGRGYDEIEIPSDAKVHEATAVALASDWHFEERVTRAETNGLNEYNAKIAHARAGAFFTNLVKLVLKEQRGARIRNGLLWLGGDLISGNIHAELLETNRLGPVEAAIEVMRVIGGGIQYLLDHTDLAWHAVCSVGNHERITKKRRIKTAVANNLAAFVYYALAAQFADNPRVTFRLPDAYHTYVDVHGFVCRFHHGDAIRYGGGIGGVHIPLRKKIAQWNKSKRAAYDFFGHFHQMVDGGYYLGNGSLIGHSSYGIEIGAEYEPPRQTLTLIDSRHGKTGVFPIFVES